MKETGLEVSYDQLDKYDALIFDLDGTLIDTECRHNIIMNELYREYGGSGSPDNFSARFGISPVGLALALLDHFNIDRSKMDEIMVKKYDRTKALLEETGIPTLPALDVARHYQGKKPIGIATGATRKYLATYNQQVKLTDIFGDNIITADDVVHYKPHPETYLRVAQKLGVDPSRCLVFEDLQIGVQSALLAGMSCYHVETNQIFTPDQANPKFKQLLAESNDFDINNNTEETTSNLANSKQKEPEKVPQYRHPDDYELTNFW